VRSTPVARSLAGGKVNAKETSALEGPPQHQHRCYRYDVERTVMIQEWNLDPQTGATRPAMDMEGVLPSTSR